MRELQIFTNEEFGEMRTLLIDDQPWFVGKDVAKVLGYENQNRDIVTHVDVEDRKMLDKTQYENGIEFNYKELGQRGGWIINESGLYSLILSSKLPNAKKFKRWVTSEVLPQIRITGGYIDEGATSQQLEQLQQKIAKLLNYKIKGDTINDVCSATGLRRKTIKEYLFDHDWVEEYNGEISTYDGRYIYIMRRKDVHFTKKGLDKILKDLQPRKPKRVFFDKELYRK